MSEANNMNIETKEGGQGQPQQAQSEISSQSQAYSKSSSQLAQIMEIEWKSEDPVQVLKQQAAQEKQSHGKMFMDKMRNVITSHLQTLRELLQQNFNVSQIVTALDATSYNKELASQQIRQSQYESQPIDKNVVIQLLRSQNDANSFNQFKQIIDNCLDHQAFEWKVQKYAGMMLTSSNNLSGKQKKLIREQAEISFNQYSQQILTLLQDQDFFVIQSIQTLQKCEYNIEKAAQQMREFKYVDDGIELIVIKHFLEQQNIQESIKTLLRGVNKYVCKGVSLKETFPYLFKNEKNVKQGQNKEQLNVLQDQWTEQQESKANQFQLFILFNFKISLISLSFFISILLLTIGVKSQKEN